MQRSQFLNRLAYFISGITSPFIVTTVVGLGVIAARTSTTTSLLRWGIPFLVLPVGLPLTYILLGIRAGTITDLHIKLREQRLEPFLLATLGAAVVTYSYNHYHAPFILVLLAATLTLNGLLFTLLTYYWKVSVHTASYAGAVIIATFLIHPALFALDLFLPAIAWSRIRRGRHDLPQTIAASVVSSVLTAGILWYYY